jgi:hypothetical protein
MPDLTVNTLDPLRDFETGKLHLACPNCLRRAFGNKIVRRLFHFFTHSPPSSTVSSFDRLILRLAQDEVFWTSL